MATPEDIHAGPPGMCGETERSPLWRWWDEEQGNAHTLIVGMSGPPKTTGFLSLLFRLAAPETPTQVVVSAAVGTLAARKEGG